MKRLFQINTIFVPDMPKNVKFDEVLAISKAMDVFWKKGYSGASMRDLTDAMGINSSSLYNTIGDKHQLFVKCIKNYTESRRDAAEKQFQNVASPINAIEQFINGAVHSITNEPNSCLAIKTTFEMAIDDLEVQKILRSDSTFTYNLILGFVEKAIGNNEIKITNDAKMLTDYIINNFTGWHESFIINQDKKRIKKMAQFLIEVLKQ
ncbi:HTH-type transcriptional repressor ComR [Mariniflexile rhizosphaerae]|uniref:TetR/AcrR family transcriptional regulator n=1 Tax=unclassified Mariniflexile TaxID=2643887 RepID=UPI000CBFEA7A|nr:TetR/AcrR family transcriptional regulator [Mariniflexile sp. TRM1-10]AXP82155.1 HTH-type transcriptional repressor ComR [Mariniflexile sp. TRM1-10]PLB20198.1 MAG: Transcriptional regulator, TetR family [Flavobacteriaceae bacterium FS1-H7996/R]